MSGLKTIMITDESAQFLKELYERLTTQSNRHTADPYYFTVRKDILVPAFDGCGAETRYSCDKGHFEGLLAEEDAREIAREREVDEDQFLSDFCTKHEMTWEEQYQGVFLTEKACEDFIKYKSHHISGKNIGSYVEYAQHNPEFLQVKNLLKELGKQL